MKVLLYGSPLTVRYVKPLLIDNGVDVVPVTTENAEEYPPEVNQFMDGIDMVFVDAVEKYPRSALRKFSYFPEVPVVMLINGKFSNWDELFQSEVQGYVSISGTIKVVYSRLKAIMRRISD